MQKIIKKHALQNAVNYNGKADANAVIAKVAREIKITPEIVKQINDLVEEINVLDIEQQKIELKNIAPELLEKKKIKKELKLPELKNTKNLVMRFAPFPSGALHIGNARPAILNDEYCKIYDGKLLLVIDDTIGSEEKPVVKEGYDLILDAADYLKLKIHKVYYKSDRLKIYYKYAEELIKKDKAYVCYCDSEKLRENRKNQIECRCRSKSIKENLIGWKSMFKAESGSMVLRIKTSMQHKNPAFRDRVIFRISDRKHPKVNARVWPLLDFSWAIDDHLLKVTAILRGKELMIESEMEKYIWDIFRWQHAEIIHNGLLKLKGVKISKSKSGDEVLSGRYIGWNDPRTWSIQSLRDRGIHPDAIRSFLLKFGVNQTEITVPVDDLYSENKKFIESSSRYFFVDNPRKIKIKNAVPGNVKIPLHPTIKRGFRNFKTSDEFYVADNLEQDKLYRLMHLFNFKNMQFVSEELNKQAKLIHWLPVSKELPKIKIIMPDGEIRQGLAESAVKKLKIGDIVQFERFGFCRMVKKNFFFFAHR